MIAAKKLTVQEIAKYLQLHDSTVRRLAEQGKIPAYRIGRQFRFDLDAVLEALRMNRGHHAATT